MEGSICHLCTQAATSLCVCQSPPLALCSHCQELHQERSEGPHFPLPGLELPSEETVQQARDHYIRISAAGNWLHRSLEEVQKCEQAIREAYEKAAERLKNYAEERIQALMSLSVALTELISATSQEIVANLIEKRAFPRSQLGNLIWNFSNSVHPWSMDIFHWKVSTSTKEIDAIQVSFWTPFQELSQFHVKRSFQADNPYPEGQLIGSFLDYKGPDSCVSSSTVVYVTSSSLRFFDCSTDQWQSQVPLCRPVQADETSSYGLLATGEVLLTGGGLGVAAWNSVYLLNRHGTVIELNPMRKPRRRHALIIHLGFAYIFGGWSQTREKSTEKILAESCDCLERCHWTAMSDMLFERSSFNPCAYGALVYLCGGSGTETAEVFDPVEELFAALPFELPESTETFSVVSDSTLHIISKEFICRWQLNTQLCYYPNDRSQIWGSMTPVSLRNFVYFPFIIKNKGDVKRLDLSDYEWTQIPSPE